MVVVLAPAELRRQSLPADTNLFIVLVELAFDMLKGFVRDSSQNASQSGWVYDLN